MTDAPPTASPRVLVKGTLRPPAPCPLSYTQGPTPKDEVAFQKAGSQRQTPAPVEVVSTSLPQPFVNPAGGLQGRPSA
ncbi:uncharacterized protein E0L32_010152 [Thyridium curvatum]|uniref:Uncharacterized protein n=1 Tax=Thyridium curvatum TaxID=1093900 RepID=A0A507AHD9_9PEZI|nr:uncharacterized protein E0L32_010152 [Thyridium curvatum]TPX08422.1 hypothetical protein E0L32_010152 [Thyridium curvatum]